MEHVSRWEKIAVVTDMDWIRHSVNIFGYLIPGEIKAYPAAAEGDAWAYPFRPGVDQEVSGGIQGLPAMASRRASRGWMPWLRAVPR